jgi:hypothetical protein
MKRLKYGTFTGMTYKVPTSKMDKGFNSFMFFVVIFANITIWYVVWQRLMEVL